MRNQYKIILPHIGSNDSLKSIAEANREKLPGRNEKHSKLHTFNQAKICKVQFPTTQLYQHNSKATLIKLVTYTCVTANPFRARFRPSKFLLHRRAIQTIWHARKHAKCFCYQWSVTIFLKKKHTSGNK